MAHDEHDPIGSAVIGEAPQDGWKPVGEDVPPPDPDGFADGDGLNALDFPEQADGYRAPADPDAEPVPDGGEA